MAENSASTDPVVDQKGKRAGDENVIPPPPKRKRNKKKSRKRKQIAPITPAFAETQTQTQTRPSKQKKTKKKKLEPSKWDFISDEEERLAVIETEALYAWLDTCPYSSDEYYEALKSLCIVTDDSDTDDGEERDSDLVAKHYTNKPPSELHCSSTRSIVVKGLKSFPSEDDLREALTRHFSRFGRILCITIDKEFANIDYFDPKAAKEALQFDQSKTGGLYLTVARPIT